MPIDNTLYIVCTLLCIYCSFFELISSTAKCYRMDLTHQAIGIIYTRVISKARYVYRIYISLPPIFMLPVFPLYTLSNYVCFCIFNPIGFLAAREFSRYFALVCAYIYPYKLKGSPKVLARTMAALHFAAMQNDNVVDSAFQGINSEFSLANIILDSCAIT